jgi:hypothetical protein
MVERPGSREGVAVDRELDPPGCLRHAALDRSTLSPVEAEIATVIIEQLWSKAQLNDAFTSYG